MAGMKEEIETSPQVSPWRASHGPRSLRDWAVDVACFLLSMAWTAICTEDLLSDDPQLLISWTGTRQWIIWVDLGLGSLLAIALWWRRRWPVALALAGALGAAVSITAVLPFSILAFTVAVHRGMPWTAWLAAAGVAANAVFTAIRPERDTAFWESFTWGAVFFVIILLWGTVVRSRRQLVVSLRDRAERAEAEQQLRVAQARSLERTRIAREMHDVLAHRISLLSLHAGGLEINPHLEPGEVARAAGVIRASAHQALQDLREVIGVLREPAERDSPERPQPTLDQLPALAAESRTAGMRVELRVEVAEGLPTNLGRTAYRIVQEGLTNARKHAAGTVVRVAVTGKPGEGVTVAIRNPAPVSRPDHVIPGTGTGLIGLAERAVLAGGRLAHGHTPEGEFLLEAWLPWPP